MLGLLLPIFAAAMDFWSVLVLSNLLRILEDIKESIQLVIFGANV